MSSESLELGTCVMTEPPKSLLVVSFGPHRFRSPTLQHINLLTLIALAPTALLSLYYFRGGALKVILISLLTAVLVETGVEYLRRRPLTWRDGSVAIQGVLLAFLLPANMPWWGVIIGASVLVLLGRQVFGGNGYYAFNPVLIGWAFVRVSWSAAMQLWPAPLTMEPMESMLFYYNLEGFEMLEGLEVSLGGLLKGLYPGPLGAICVGTLTVGGIFLLVMRTIKWRITLSFLLAVAGMSTILWKLQPAIHGQPLYPIMLGMIPIAAFFLVTDSCSSPASAPGQILFGIFAGVLTVIIRAWGAYDFGVPFAILLANAFAPLFDRIHRSPFGKEGRHA